MSPHTHDVGAPSPTSPMDTKRLCPEMPPQPLFAEAPHDILFREGKVAEGTPEVRGYDFSQGLDYGRLLGSYLTSGFQATSMGQAVNEINHMIKWRLSDEPLSPNTPAHLQDEAVRAQTRCTIFLGYTSNLISSGLRDTFRYLVMNRMVDVIVTSAGGIEEDFIKCLGPTYVGDFALKGSELRAEGVNRIGNLLMPNSNYVAFERWIMPVLDQMLVEQRELGTRWTPSLLIARLGREINHPDSVYYWAYKNNIPVFCPSITDGSIGDMLYFHSYRNPGLLLDVIHDTRGVNNAAIQAAHTGMILLGGGMPKHHINNANLMRNGADFSVNISTAQEFDGSDSGARPDEAVSWGKIKVDANPVKAYADATLVFPLIVAETFVKNFETKTPTTSSKTPDPHSSSSQDAPSSPECLGGK